jgi:sec-independent protein translocase protein TatB
MNLLGMGPMELLLIVVLALIVFGPARLPEIMGQVGKAIGDFRRATSDLSDEFNRTIQAELQETRAMVDEAKSTLTDARESLTEVHTSVTSAVSLTPAPVRTAAPPEALPASNGVSAESHTDALTNGSVPAAVTPPLAETARWSSVPRSRPKLRQRQTCPNRAQPARPRRWTRPRTRPTSSRPRAQARLRTLSTQP